MKYTRGSPPSADARAHKEGSDEGVGGDGPRAAPPLAWREKLEYLGKPGIEVHGDAAKRNGQVVELLNRRERGPGAGALRPGL